MNVHNQSIDLLDGLDLDFLNVGKAGALNGFDEFFFGEEQFDDGSSSAVEAGSQTKVRGLSATAIGPSSGGIGGGVFYPESALGTHHPSFDKTFDKDWFFRRLSVGGDGFQITARKDEAFGELYDDAVGRASNLHGSVEITDDFIVTGATVDLSAYQSLAAQLQASSSCGGGSSSIPSKPTKV